MSYVQLSEGGSRWLTPSACGPGSLELSKSDSDMASKLFTFTLHLHLHALHPPPPLDNPRSTQLGRGVSVPDGIYTLGGF